MNFKRLFQHLLTPDWMVRFSFPSLSLSKIEKAIAASEKTHKGELRFAVEMGLDLPALLNSQTARQRATEVFSQLRVWDTEQNCGVLIYVQLLDRTVEILADRGIAACVPPQEWNAVCHRMEQAYKKGEFESGSLCAIEEIGTRLAKHFPREAGVSDAGSAKRNELSDKPIVL